MSNGDKQAFSFTEREYMGDGMYQYTHNPGLTKREYFAGLALQGVLANEALRTSLANKNFTPTEFAINQAEFLLKELENADE